MASDFLCAQLSRARTTPARGRLANNAKEGAPVLFNCAPARSSCDQAFVTPAGTPFEMTKQNELDRCDSMLYQSGRCGMGATRAGRHPAAAIMPRSDYHFCGQIMEPDFSAEQFCGNRLALLSGRDVELLRPLSELIVERRGEIVRHWFRHYALHFGDFRALPEPAFTTIFEQALADLYSALSDGDLGGHAEGVSRLGTLLGAQRMPLEEVIA